MRVCRTYTFAQNGRRTEKSISTSNTKTRIKKKVTSDQKFCSIGCYNKWVANYQNYYVSKPERAFKKKLEESKNIDSFEDQYHLEGKFFDFRVGDTLIEIDGTWWHGKGKSDEELEGIRKDIRKNDREKENIVEQSEFDLVRIWTDELDDFELKDLTA